MVPTDVVGDADMVRWDINRKLLLPAKEKPQAGRCTLAQLSNLAKQIGGDRITTWQALKAVLGAHCTQNAAKQGMPFAPQRSSSEPVDSGISANLAACSAQEIGAFVKGLSMGAVSGCRLVHALCTMESV